MKKMFKYMLFAVPALLLSVACNETEQSDLENSILTESMEWVMDDEQRVKLYIDATESEVYPILVGETLTLEYVSTPASGDVTFPGVVWSSTDESVVTVDQEGHVTAVGAGVATVSVRPDTPNRIAVANLTFTVSETLVPATAIALSYTNDYWDPEGTVPSCYEGETLQMKAAITPDDATFKTVKWTSTDETIAKVDYVSGVVTGVKQGYVDIVATALDPENPVSATQKVYINKIIEPIGIKLTSASAVKCAILSKTFTATYETQPTLATRSLLQWTSSDENIATVAGGVVTFKGFGEVTITVTCPGEGEVESGFAKSASFKVNIPAGYLFENFDNPDNVTWWLNPSHYGKTELKVTENGDHYMAVTCKDNGNNFRGDFQGASGSQPATLHNGNYPIFAMRLDFAKDWYPAEDISSCNISADWAGGVSESGATYAIGGKLNNNAWTSSYIYSDKSRVIIYDLTAREFGTGGVLPTNESVSFTIFQMKYADVKFSQNYPTTPWTYRVFWAETFASVDDVIAKMNAEAEQFGYTYEVITTK